MSWDIYGNTLRAGHCEVHPHVHEPYPCSVCHQEGKYRDHQSSMVENQYKEDMMQARIDELEKKNKELYADLALAMEALEDVALNCELYDGKTGANMETRFGVMGIDARTALNRLRAKYNDQETEGGE